MARLPKDLRPTHYALQVSLDLDQLTFQGCVSIHLDVLHNTTSVVLHSKDLEITSTKIEDLSGKTTEIPAVSSDPEQQTITIPLGEALKSGAKIVLHLWFHGTIMEYGRTPGFQWTSYRTPSGDEKRAFSTSCEPIGARCIFPCFDEPEFKATISSTVVINQDLTCISNMDIASSDITAAASGILASKRIHFTPLHPCRHISSVLSLATLTTSNRANFGSQ